MVLIPFDPADVRFEIEDRWKWWDSMRGWLAERGYALYDYLPEGDGYRTYAHWKPSRPCPGPVDFPYPYMGSDDDPTGYGNDYGEGRVVFAQDNEGRHLAVKLLKGGSEEVKILKFLKDEPCLRDLESFPYVLPVLDLLPCEDHFFAIMPRWGDISFTPWFPTLYHAALHMRCLLKALTFLHRCRIFHRDVAHRNILVNRLTGFRDLDSTYLMQFELEEEGKLKYVLFDFDRAIMLDEETYGQSPMLPIHVVDRGFYAPPYERLLGYPDFDPFKYDVACLGIYFDETFGDYIPDAPLFAPLIDGMVTADIEKRFSAAQALAFMDSILGNISQTIPSFKQSPIWLGNYYDRDRWKDLPEDFVSTWASYRDNSFSGMIKFQMWFLHRGRMLAWYVLYGCRSAHRAVSGIFKSIFRFIFSMFII
ncbi:kinase-like domain-containing protein [Gymnopilus junonius]|uniref:Kinase-like domain-containing protein n=1 Tax=Gymnopilus junonius TaxID=109634 RepID=A0A9P5NE02_GYMJU|nr:kinase-like domain-containing protein [Gymnopilus junonius]